MSWKVAHKATQHTKKVRRIAETGTPTIGAALTGVLVAFGVDPYKAAAISAMVMALAPALLTYARERGWL